MPTAEPSPPFAFVGDALCLDLLNTVVQGRDLLGNFADYARWLAEGGGLSAAEASGAVARWGEGPAGVEVLVHAKELRESLRAAVQAVRHGEPMPAGLLTTLNALLARSPARAELVVGAEGRVSKRHRLHVVSPADLLAPVAESAADLLANADPALIRRCASPACSLVFLDTSKNHRRRWCSMAVCGNRAKVAAHRARRQPVPGG